MTICVSDIRVVVFVKTPYQKMFRTGCADIFNGLHFSYEKKKVLWYFFYDIETMRSCHMASGKN